MKKIIKEAMLFLLAVMLCFETIVPLSGMEAKADNGDISSGEGWRITADGTLIVNIPNGNFPKHRDNSTDVPDWHDYKDEIYKAEVSMGSPTDLTRMFADLTNLTSVTFTNCNTSDVEFMSRMFNNCSSLTSLDLSNFDTSNVTNMAEMFSGCRKLTSLNVSSFNTSKVTNMSRMFNNCSSFTSLDLSNFDTSNVIDMSYMFASCSSLTSLNVSSFNVFHVTRMPGMFSGCSSLTSLNLNSFDTSNVTSMSKMFSGCSSLTSLNLNSFDTSKCTNMESMFGSCSALSSITFGDKFDTSKVSNMSSMFSGTSNLQTFSVKKPLDTRSVTNMKDIFKGCIKLSDSALDAIGYKDFDTSKVEIFGDIFKSCENLSLIDLSRWDFSQATTPITFGFTFEHELTVHTIIMPANMPTAIQLPVSFKNPRKWYSTYNPSAVYEETCANIGTAITYISELTPKLDKTTLTLTDTNKTADLTTTVSPLNITDTHVIYKSTNPAVATVDNTGRVTAISSGSCEITVTADAVNKASDTCSVTVHLHEWSADWEKNATHHWHTCTVTNPACNLTDNRQKDGYSEHIYDDETDKTCNTCGYVRKIKVTGVSLDKHSIKLIDQGSTAVLKATVTPSVARFSR